MLTGVSITVDNLNALQERLQPQHIVRIREADCIGCTKCIQACPVDAIIGAAKQMHVILEQDCTGCELCIEPCPVDCIELIPIPQAQFQPARARAHYDAKLKRGAFKRLGTLTPTTAAITAAAASSLDKKRFIAEAVARAKAKKLL